MSWSPNQYLKFSAERFAPFDDLIKLIDLDAMSRTPEPAVIDLGCGTGELTLMLAERLPGAKILGIDNSPEMLAKANLNGEGNADVTFELKAIEEIEGEWDLIFSNAAIHWVEDHPALLEKLWRKLNPGGQIVVQLPSGVRSRAQRAVMEVAETDPYLSAMNGWKWVFPALPVDEYPEVLFRLGTTDIVAFEKVYPHILKDGEAVYEWVAGTTMTSYTKRLPESLIENFKADVKAEVVRRYPGSPLIFPFRRIFFSGRKPE